MLRTIEDFEKDWAYEEESTLKVLRTLTDESLGQKVTDEGRSLGYLAWHLALTPGEMMGLVGVKVDGPPHDAPMPATAAEIADAYERASRSMLGEIKANWTDETLLQTDEMYGETWARGLTLFFLIAHQAHHRG
ncbi:MAG TPA: DinB family protein, partial [Pyrinomonadaceae bacterium]|nr:DinB family protein [Pyrinomonadaceae bacterium]